MTNSPHVAVLPSPGMGHVIPLLQLAKNLVIHHNLKVSFLFITTEASPAQIELLRSPSLPSGLQVVDLPLVDISKIVHDDMTVLAHLSIIVQESLRTLDQVLIDLHYPKAVIIDLFCTDAIQICKKLSIPVYSFFTASPALLAFSLYLPTLDREVECEYGELLEPIQMPGCSPIRTEDLLDQVQNRKIDEYKWYLLHVSRLPQADGIFVNSWESLEPVWLSALRNNSFFKKILINSPVHPVGPLIKKKEPITESDRACLKWLDDQPTDSVLFVSLGSGGTLTADQLTEMAWGLELSQQRFILVVRKPTDASGSGAFFNAGGGGEDNPISYLPEGFVKRTEQIGLVIPSWAPQVEVLRHQSTGGFLSHCGWNSSLESIAHGVPIITWPLYAEQRMNATMLSEEIGVAVRPVDVSGKGVVGREEIERVVRLLMEGDEGKVMRRKARELQRSSEKPLAIGGASYNSLSMVAEAWKANTNNKTEGA